MRKQGNRTWPSCQQPSSAMSRSSCPMSPARTGLDFGACHAGAWACAESTPTCGGEEGPAWMVDSRALGQKLLV